MQNLSQLLLESAGRYEKTTALQIRNKDGFRKLSFRELAEHSEALASFLASQGVGPGTVVALAGENRPEWGLAFFAILRTGAAALPIDKLLKKDEIASILHETKPDWIIASGAHLHPILELRDTAHVLSLDEKEEARTSLLEALAEGRKRGNLPESTVQRDALAVMIFTSGTTGRGKGVMLSHGNILSNIEAFKSMFPPEFFRSNFLSILPLNHAFELTGGFLTPIHGGGTVTTQDSLKPAGILQTMRETKTEIILLVPAVLDMLRHNLLSHIHRSRHASEKFKFAMHIASLFPFRNFRRGLFNEIHAAFGGHLQYFISGGAPLSVDLQTFFDKLGFEVIQGYGLTETAPVLTVNPLHNTKRGSVGKPIPGVHIKIDGDPEGEIFAKGRNIMQGYFKDPEATRDVMQDDYFRTGDLGHLDKDGYLYITGRRKNVIITASGRNISPEELEGLLSKIPYIKEACVLGRKVELEEEVTAVVIPNLDRLKADEISERDARARIWDEVKRINAQIAEYKRIRNLVLWNGEFPKTTTLKVKRSELEELLRNGEKGKP